MKKEHAIDASGLEILATLKSNPAMWSQVKRLDDAAEEAIDRAGQVLKLESLRALAQSGVQRQGGKRSKKTPEMA